MIMVAENVKSSGIAISQRYLMAHLAARSVVTQRYGMQISRSIPNHYSQKISHKEHSKLGTQDSANNTWVLDQVSLLQLMKEVRLIIKLMVLKTYLRLEKVKVFQENLSPMIK